MWLCEGSSGSVKSKCRKFALHMPRRTFRVPTNCIALSIQNGFIIFASVNNSPLMTTATRTIRENNDTKSRKNKNIDNNNRTRISFCLAQGIFPPTHTHTHTENLISDDRWLPLPRNIYTLTYTHTRTVGQAQVQELSWSCSVTQRRSRDTAWHAPETNSRPTLCTCHCVRASPSVCLCVPVWVHHNCNHLWTMAQYTIVANCRWNWDDSWKGRQIELDSGKKQSKIVTETPDYQPVATTKGHWRKVSSK